MKSQKVLAGLLLNLLVACKTTAPASSEVKIFGSDIPTKDKPYKVSLYRYAYTEELKHQFELLSAAAGFSKLRTLGLFKVNGLEDSGLVMAEEGVLAKDDRVSREHLQFIQLSDLMRVDNSQGYMISLVDPAQKLHPIGFMLQSSGDIIFLCDSKPHMMQTELDASSPLKEIIFDCDINLKENFEIRVNKTEAKPSGDVYPFLSPTQLAK